MDLKKIVKEKLSENDTFPTMTSLLRYIGFPESRSQNSINAQVKELGRFIAIGKSNKINKKTKKISNELMILDVYDMPKLKEDKRRNQEIQFFIDELKKIIISLEDFSLSYGELIRKNIINMDSDAETVILSNRIVYYKTYLFNYLKSKIDTSLRQLSNQYDDDFTWEYTYIVKYLDSKDWLTLNWSDLEYIEGMKTSIKTKILAKHNNKYRTEVLWKDIAFRYRNLMYKQLNDDLKSFKNIDKIYKVLITKSRLEPNEDDIIDIEKIRKQLFDVMELYINNENKKSVIDNKVVDFHNKLFKI